MRHEVRSLPTASPKVLAALDGVTFQRERLSAILREVVPLMEADWRENGVDHVALPLRPNFNQYLDYDLLGVLWVVTARDAGTLIGFVFAFVNPHIDHAETGWAIINWYWLYPDYRGQGVGRAMVTAMEDLLRLAGVKAVEASEKISHAHGLFGRLGYKPTDVIHRKILEA